MRVGACQDVEYVQLDWNLENGLVTVVPRDRDRFCIRVRRAIEVLQQASRADSFTEQFNLLLRTLAKWINDTTGIAKAYLTLRDGALAFVVMRESSEYDDDFEDSLSELDYRISRDRDLSLITMDAMALPLSSEDAACSFIDDGFAFAYVKHGD